MKPSFPLDPTVDHLLATRRWCYTISVVQDPKRYGGYVPSLVIENDDGHRPMTGNPGQAPWVWGKTLDEAEATCRAVNAKLGIDEKTAFIIVCSTFHLDKDRA